MTNLEQAAENGRKAAESLHRNRDASLARKFAEYQSRLVTNAPAGEKAAILRAFNDAYREESSYYIGRR